MSKPPPESEEEVLQSGLLKRAKPGSVVIHSDGAQGIKSVLKKHFPKLKHRSVSHKDMEFVRKVRAASLPSGKSASSSGTQAIDTTWKSLGRGIPDEIHTKKDHAMNPVLEDYVWSWLYRVNHRNEDGFAKLGAYMKQA